MSSRTRLQKEAGLKRGDWVIAVDGEEISQSSYYEDYIERPSGAHTFTLGKYNPYVEIPDDGTAEDDYNYAEFDTIGVVQLPTHATWKNRMCSKQSPSK